MPLSDKRNKLIKQSFVWIISVLFAAVIGVYVKDYYARSKPRLEIASIDFSDTTSLDAKIKIPTDLLTAYENVPFSIKSFNSQMVIKEYDNAVEDSKSNLDNLRVSQEALTSAISILKSRAKDYPKDKLRKELLKLWVTPSGTALEMLLKGVINKYGILRDIYKYRKFAHYRKHPEEWKDPSIARVSITWTRGFNLAEEIIAPDDSSRQKSAKTQINIRRRIWIFMERDFMLDLFEKVDKELKSTIIEVSNFVDLLKKNRNAQFPTRLKTIAVITNYGGKPAIIRSLGFLAIRTSRGVFPIEVNVIIDDEVTRNTAFVVEPGKTIIRVLTSKLNIEELNQEHFKKSAGLEALYNTEAVNCNLFLYRMEDGDGARVLSGQHEVVFGKSFYEEVATALKAKALENIAN